MKIIDIHKTITVQELYNEISRKLNERFKKQRDLAIKFTIRQTHTAVEITQPDLYEGVLFAIEPSGTHLNIKRSENYVDDVNSLTVESILESLFDDVSGDKGSSMVVEG